MTSNERVSRLFANELVPKEDRRRVPGPESGPLLSLDAAIAFLQETQTTCREDFNGYFGPVIVSTALRKTADALAGMGIGRPSWPLDEAAMEAIGAERALSDALKWCFAKREEQAGQERTADTKTDSRKKAGALVPENSDVARLARDIKKRLPKGDTKIGIAREFTGGDEKQAQTLLRQLRRFPALLD